MSVCFKISWTQTKLWHLWCSRHQALLRDIYSKGMLPITTIALKLQWKPKDKIYIKYFTQTWTKIALRYIHFPFALSVDKEALVPASTCELLSLHLPALLNFLCLTWSLTCLTFHYWIFTYTSPNIKIVTDIYIWFNSFI